MRPVYVSQLNRPGVYAFSDGRPALAVISVADEAAFLTALPRLLRGDAPYVCVVCDGPLSPATLRAQCPFLQTCDRTVLIATKGYYVNHNALAQLLNTVADDRVGAAWFTDEATDDYGIAEALGGHIKWIMSTELRPTLRRAVDSLDYYGLMTGQAPFDPEELPAGLWEMTCSQLLDRCVAGQGDQTAFSYTALPYTRTYAAFRQEVDALAKGLLALGVRPGNRVAVWADNGPYWFLTFWAAVKIGAVLVTVNTAYKQREVSYLLAQSETKVLVMSKGYTDTSYAAIMTDICPDLATHTAGEALHSPALPFLRHVVTAGYTCPGMLSLNEVVQRGQGVSQETLQTVADGVRPGDVCNMQYTSGTTGFPKGVMLTHRGIINNGRFIGDRLYLTEEDRMMIQVPMFHCFGMVLAMLACMTHGSAMFPLPYFNAGQALACISREKITAFHGVPTMFSALLAHPDFAKTDFSAVRTGIMAGSVCPPALMRRVVKEMGMKEITVVYGQTEASPGCTMSDACDDPEERLSGVGRQLPYCACAVADGSGAIYHDTRVGEFVTKGYHVMRGYYKMPGMTAAVKDENGWLHTGDLACRTQDGVWHITGRLDDTINRGGENIYPQEIEAYLYTHPLIREAQVVGTPSDLYGEEVAAYIIVKEGAVLREEDVTDFVRRGLARHKAPTHVAFVESFPTNAAGKILKYKLRQDAARRFSST